MNPSTPAAPECPFKKGDIVRHVVGGTQMQVLTVHSAKLVECHWFDALHTPHKQGFRVEDLYKPEPVEPNVPVAAGEPVAGEGGEEKPAKGGKKAKAE